MWHYCTYDLKVLHKAEEEAQSEKSSDEDNTEEDCNDDDEELTLSNKGDYKGFKFLHHDVLCSTHDKLAIAKSWILMDSQSIVGVISNGKIQKIFEMQNAC